MMHTHLGSFAVTVDHNLLNDSLYQSPVHHVVTPNIHH